MVTPTCAEDVPLPKTWPAHVKSLILQAISLARFAIVHTRSWASDSVSSRVRLQASLERAQAEISSLQDELRIKERVPSYTSSGTFRRVVSTKTFL